MYDGINDHHFFKGNDWGEMKNKLKLYNSLLVTNTKDAGHLLKYNSSPVFPCLQMLLDMG